MSGMKGAASWRSKRLGSHALESKDAQALDMLLASSIMSVDIDGSVSNKSDFLASIKAPDYQPSQAVTEQSNVQVYGNAAVVVGIFRIKERKKGSPMCGASVSATLG
jgi:ketosteroid isomerase-like protein